MQKKNSEHPSVTFFKLLYQHCEDGFINLRFLHKETHQVINKFILLSEIETIPGILKRYQNDHNCFFAVATRVKNDGTKAGILQVPALWIDLDLKGLSPEEKNKRRKRVRDFPLNPSLWVNSGGGFHAYFLLKEPASKEDIPQVENLLKKLAPCLGGDAAATDASRILRIPGTQNHKYPGGIFASLNKPHPERQYNLSDFDSILPQLEQLKVGGEPRLPEGWEAELLRGVKEGERNLAITRLAGRFIGLRLPKEEALTLLLDANSRFKPPLPLKEVETCLDSIIKTHQRSHPSPTTYGQAEIKQLPELPTLADIYDMPIKVEWVVEKLIPKQAITVLHGRGGIGKTWLMLQMGSCVAEAISFCGLTTQKMPCYYVDFENPLAILHDRALVLGKSGLRIWHSSNLTPPPRLDSGDWEWYKYLSPGFMIVDSLRAAQLLDENSSRDMTIIMMRLKVLRDLGFTPVLIHHTPKSDERTYKGSTAIQDQCDHVLSLDRVKSVGSEQEIDEEDLDSPLRLGVRGKSRYEHFSIYLQFDPTKGFDLAPDPDESSLKDIHSLLMDFKAREEKSPNQSQIVTLAKELNINKKKLLRLLRKGEGRLWTTITHPQSRAILYDPIPHLPIVPPLYSTEQWVNGLEPQSPDKKSKTVELPENTVFTHCPNTPKNNGLMDGFHYPDIPKKNETPGTMENDPKKEILRRLKMEGSVTKNDILKEAKGDPSPYLFALDELVKSGQVERSPSGLRDDPDCYSIKDPDSTKENLYEVLPDGEITY